ncbi:hypothetical protein [Anoxybacteroides tepidamans]|uniref:hypothetical protein n=1 Tax=Anoxybacteroides tepidamans TaxID=265948 RepID=UPI0004820809|nr:hypothetical protein [Anoxybacillus tepidamans]
MKPFLFMLAALVIAAPLLLILPIGLSRSGKIATLAVSLLLSLLAVSAQSVFPLWQLGLLLLLLALAITYLLHRQFGYALYAAAKGEEEEDAAFPFDTEFIDERASTAMKTDENELAVVENDDIELEDKILAAAELELSSQLGEEESSEEKFNDWPIPSSDSETALEVLEEIEPKAERLDDEELVAAWPLSALESEEWLAVESEIDQVVDKELNDWPFASLQSETLLAVEEQSALEPLRSSGEELDDSLLFDTNAEPFKSEANDELPVTVIDALDPSVEESNLLADEAEESMKGWFEQESAYLTLVALEDSELEADEPALNDDRTDNWKHQELFDDIVLPESAAQDVDDATAKLDEALIGEERLGKADRGQMLSSSGSPVRNVVIQSLAMELQFMRGRLEKEEYEQRIFQCLRSPLAEQDYYMFARLLAEHYLLEKEYEKLAPWLAHLREKFCNYPILIDEIEFFAQTMKSYNGQVW